MEEIEVGEYVRDKEGHITKVIGTLSLFKDVELYLGEDDYQYSDNAIAKHSKNIIDLIEVGDYVNGAKVADIDIDDDEEGTGKKYLWCEEQAIIEEDIETIVTCEQFTNMEYKVEEN